MVNDADFHRIAIWATGDLSADEADRTRLWIEEDPEREQVAAQFVPIVDAGPAAWDARLALARVRATEPIPAEAPAVHAPRESTRRVRVVHTIRPRRDHFWRRRSVAAAVMLVLVGISWFAAHQYAGVRRAASAIGMSAREVSTRRGERATVDLADGTRVILAPESRLRIPAAYATGAGLGARDVQLDGEGFFDVRHDAARPFRVRTTHGIAEDLGTEFVVTAYPDTRGMRVVVASGEVAVHRPATPSASTMPSRPLAVLHAGDLAHLDPNGAVHMRQGVDVAQWSAWTSGRLAFTDTPLAEVLPALTRWYDVEFHVNDARLAARPVSVSFERKSVQNVVEILELLLDARAVRRGQVVTFVARTPSSSHQE